MPVNQITLAQISNELMALYDNMNTTLTGQWTTFANDIISIGVAGLQAAPYSLTSADATAVFNAAQDMLNFAKVMRSLAKPAAAPNEGRVIYQGDRFAIMSNSGRITIVYPPARGG